jgi:cadherin 2 type 1 (N-cadherin)
MLAFAYSEKCNNVEKKLMVSAVIDGSDLILNCTAIDGGLLEGQQLVWTEGGRELNVSLMTNDSSVVIVSDMSVVDYGEYTCQCYNRQSYSINDIQKLILAKSYKQHCSEVNRIKVTSNVNDTGYNITYHYVSTPGDVVTVVCPIGSLWRVSANGELVVTNDSNITVRTPSNQGKYLCMHSNGMLMEIHYILIKNYEPVHFLMPMFGRYHDVPFRVGSETPPSLCVVYSPFNLTNFELIFKIGNLIYSSIAQKVSSIIYYENLAVIQTIPNSNNDNIISGSQIVCVATDKWEETRSKKYIMSFMNKEFEIIPSPCMDFYFTKDKMICNITSDIPIHIPSTSMKIRHNSRNITTVYIPEEMNKTPYMSSYQLDLSNINTTMDGVFYCIMRIKEYNITLTQTLQLTISTSSITSTLDLIRGTTSTNHMSSSSNDVTTTVLTPTITSTIPSQSIMTSANNNTLLISSVTASAFIIITGLIIASVLLLITYIVLRSKRNTNTPQADTDRPAINNNHYIIS